MIKCCNIVCSTEIVLNGTDSLNITIPTKTYNNGECFGLCLQQSIPSSGTPLPVNIVMGTSTYPLLKPCGNQVMSDQLRTKRTYCIRAGGNPAHFTVTSCNRLCGTTYVVPQIIPTATAPTAEA